MMNNEEGVFAMPRNLHTKSKVAHVMMSEYKVNCNHIRMGVRSNRKANINTNEPSTLSVGNINNSPTQIHSTKGDRENIRMT